MSLPWGGHGYDPVPKRKKMKKIKVFFLIIALSLTSWLSYGFGDSYFELSKNLDIFTLFKELNTYYVDETELSQLMKTAIDGMLQSLDPFYTNYIPESKIEDFRFMTTGQYGGIGALIHKDGEKHCDFRTFMKGFQPINLD